jgi:hypothetical protein
MKVSPSPLKTKEPETKKRHQQQIDSHFQEQGARHSNTPAELHILYQSLKNSGIFSPKCKIHAICPRNLTSKTRSLRFFDACNKNILQGDCLQVTLQ